MSRPVSGSIDALGLERFQHALELTLERLQAHEWKDSLDQAHGIAIDPDQIGQPLVIHGGIVQHADRQVAKPHVLGEQGQQRLDHARAQPFADDHAVDVASVEIARGSLDAQHPDQADALADRAESAG